MALLRKATAAIPTSLTGRKDDGYIMGKMVSEDGTQKGGSKDSANRKQRSRVEWKGYVSPQISKVEKAAYAKWRGDADEVNRALATTVQDGYTLKVDYMEDDGAYRAVLYCTLAGSKNAGWALSIFAGDWWEAAMRVVYCHVKILNADWTSLLSGRKWKDDWLE